MSAALELRVQETHVPRFELYTAAELGALPQPTWTLQHYLTDGGLSVIYGQPGHGKTFVALDWALHVATQRPWLDCATTWGPVVWVSTEGGWGLSQRIQAWQDAHEEPDLTAPYFIREPVNLMVEKDVSALIADMQAAIPGGKPKLVTFDTLHGSMMGGDENDAGDMGRVIESCRRISRTTGAHVQLVHHTTKDAQWERGSGSLRGAADTMLKAELEDTILTLTNDKQRDAPTQPSRRLRLVTVGESCVVEPLEGSGDIGVTDNDRKVARAIADVAIDGIGGTQAILGSAKAPRASIYRSLAHLKKLGYVKKERGGFSLTVPGESLLGGRG